MSKHVLIVDDDPAIAELLKLNFEAAGFNADIAGEGQAALRMMDVTGYDLIVTDIFMPQFDGLEFLRMLRKRKSNEKIIAMSGGGANLGPSSFLELARLLGAAKTFEKPFDCRKLLAAAKLLLA